MKVFIIISLMPTTLLFFFALKIIFGSINYIILLFGYQRKLMEMLYLALDVSNFKFVEVLVSLLIVSNAYNGKKIMIKISA